MKTRTPVITIIIPARHEEESILPVLRDIEQSVRLPHETIVVNDYVPGDRTGNVVRSFMKRKTTVSVFRYEGQEGKSGFGGAIQKGIAHANGDAIIPVMADGCDDVKQIDAMYWVLSRGWDVVCGSRYMPGGRKIGGPWLQGFFSSIVNLTLSFITGVPTGDISNTFKMYRRSSLRTVPVREDAGVEGSMEWFLDLYFRGARITEVATVWRGRTSGTSKFKTLERMPKYLRIYVLAVRRRLEQLSQRQTHV